MKLLANIDKQKIMLAFILVTLGVISRISLHDFFNNINNPFTTNGFLDVFFIIAVISILSGLLLGKYYVLIVPICVILITDIFYGIVDPINNALWSSWLFLFTTSGYVFIALIGLFTKRKLKINLSFFPKIFGSGIIGVIIYDLWTNFGFWLSYSKLGFYPQNFQGLASVFISGIPFMLWHILSFSLLLSTILLPIILIKDNPLFSENFMLKPIEKVYIISFTIILISASIITALI
jgi:hypothetical protein